MIRIQLRSDVEPWHYPHHGMVKGAFFLLQGEWDLIEGGLGAYVRSNFGDWVILHYSEFAVVDRDFNPGDSPEMVRRHDAREERAAAIVAAANQNSVTPCNRIARQPVVIEPAQDAAGSSQGASTMIASSETTKKKPKSNGHRHPITAATIIESNIAADVSATIAEIRKTDGKKRPTTPASDRGVVDAFARLGETKQPTGTMPKSHKKTGKELMDEMMPSTYGKPPAAEQPAPVAQPLRGWIAKLIQGVTAKDYPIDTFQRHPENRHPTEDDVVSIAGSMEEHGQWEPLIGRLLSGGGRQILSGETRWLAADKLRWKEVNAKLVVCTDAQALDIMALMNAKRTDLTPFEKARVIRLRHHPVKEGGLGQTWDEAGRVYNLTGSAAQNLVAMLAAPEIWQKRHLNPETPKGNCGDEPRPVHQATLREIGKFAHLPAFLKELEDRYQRCWWSNSKEDQFDHVREEVESVIRNPQSDEILEVQKNYRTGLPLLFDFEAHREKLGVIKLPLGKKGEEIEVCTNIKLYDKLQLEAHQAKQTKKASAATKRDEKNGSAAAAKKELSPAELKAKKQLQAEQFWKRIRNWRYEWLTVLIVPHLVDRTDIVQRIMSWLLTTSLSGQLNERNIMRRYIKQFNAKAGAKTNVWDALGEIDESTQYQATVATLEDMLRAENSNGDFPHWPRDVIEDLAGMCQLDLAAEWKKIQATSAPTSDHNRYMAFFELHQSDQLEALAKEWKHHVAENTTKAAKIKLLSYAGSRTNPFPKSIDLVKPIKSVGTNKSTKKGKVSA